MIRINVKKRRGARGEEKEMSMRRRRERRGDTCIIITQ